MKFPRARVQAYADTNGVPPATDVLAVLDRHLGRLRDLRELIGCERPAAGADDLHAARAAVAEAFDVLRMSAEALESAAKCVGGDIAVVLNDRAMFARAALARVGGVA